MANVRREAAPARRGAGSEWDPFQTMRELVGWDPFPEMFPRGRRGGEDRLPFAPAFDVRETEDAYVFEADVPGFGQEDIDINLTGNRLTVSGRREAEDVDESDTYYCCERSYGAFTRSFTLPADVDPDRIEAQLRDGILSLRIAKTAEAQPKRIQVNGGGRTKEKSAGASEEWEATKKRSSAS